MFDIIILATSEGIDQDGSPIVLRDIDGKSLLERIIETVSELKHLSNRLYIIVDDLIHSKLPSSLQVDMVLIIQGPNKGFSKSTVPYLSVQDKAEYVLVIPGDIPLISTQILQDFMNSFVYWDKQAGIIVFDPTDGKEYSRILQNKIVQYKNCSKEERMTLLCNTGIYAVMTNILEIYLPLLTDETIQDEYYLMDIFNYRFDTFIYKIDSKDNYQLNQVDTLEKFLQSPFVKSVQLYDKF